MLGWWSVEYGVMETRVQSNGLFSEPFQCMTKQLESNLLGKFIAHYQWVVTDNNYAICNK